LAQHILRKDLKKDELRETFEHGAEAVREHQKLAIYLLAAAIVVALGGFGWWTYAQRQSVQASAAFDNAMKTYQTPAGTPPVAGETVYPDDSQKYAAAAQQFSDVAGKYPRTRGGQLAQYFQALSYEKIGKNDDAKKLLRGLASGSDEEADVLARFELAQLDDRTGQADEAAKLYQQLIDKPSILVPKPVAMLGLAEHYSQSNPTEAAKLYSQIKTDYPDTPIAQQAEQALALLPGQS
jgi:predicted negative regulator of RcsB-dependent stress response